jgi:glycosyltransferase involved in cell wall biosynthesis
MSWGSDLLMRAQRGIGRGLAAWTLKRSDAFASDSETVRDYALKLGAPKERTFVFPWGVDLGRFRPGIGSTIREELNWSEDDFVLISTRSWEPIYGITELARAFARAAIVNRSLKLLFLGGGSLREEVRRTIDGAGVRDQVVYPGQVSNEALADYYAAADLYVSASYSDGSSVSLMEALACGLPALVSDLPSNQEWIQHGANGWIFTTRSERALEAGIENAFADRDQLGDMGGLARETAEAKADWSRNFEVLMRAYEIAAHAVAQ